LIGWIFPAKPAFQDRRVSPGINSSWLLASRCSRLRGGDAAAGINMVTIHAHMTHEESRILFFIRGLRPAKQLAQSVKDAMTAIRHREVSTEWSKRLR